MGKIRKSWIEKPTVEELLADIQFELEDTSLKKNMFLTEILNPNHFKLPDHGFPEDNSDLQNAMAENFELFGHLMSFWVEKGRRNVPRIKEIHEFLCRFIPKMEEFS